jgi:hypothetical protein
MATHIEMIEDVEGDLVDVQVYCSAMCYTDATGQGAYGHAWPGGMETDYDQYCDSCGAFMRGGISPN